METLMASTSNSPLIGQSLQNPQSANFRWSDLPEFIEGTTVNLSAEDGASSKGLFYQKRGTRPKVGVHIMHPRTDQTLNYNGPPLVAAGYAVLARSSRWPNNDTNTIHEALVLDVAAGIKELRNRGCEKVILLGNSGGSAMAAFYQAQARTTPPARLTHTPAGDPYDLNKCDLPPADAVVFVGCHIGQGALLAKLIDGSVVDEEDPVTADPDLDLYDPRNGFRTPPESSKYSEEFLVRYRAAQMARVRRLDVKAHSLIAGRSGARAVQPNVSSDMALRLQRAARAGWHMIIYRTTADPAFVDLHIEPDDRPVQTYTSLRPDQENYGENGFARCLTPRAWLSTWSALSSNARTVDNLRRFHDPLLIVHYAGDVGTRISEVQAMIKASASVDKQLHVVRQADHYGFAIVDGVSTTRRVSDGTDKVVSWMRERFPA
jgi:pimeloyl-ACP methyl ester carboxylesterase